MVYRRIELDACLGIASVVDYLTGSGGLQGLEPKRKQTDGIPDPPDKHYSAQDWVGTLKYQGLSLGHVQVGVSDFEYFGQRKSMCYRRQGYRHFFARGKSRAVEAVIEVFKKNIPCVLWRDEPPAADVRMAWPRLLPGTPVHQVTVEEAVKLKAAAAAVTGSGAASTIGAASAAPGRPVYQATGFVWALDR